MYVAARDRGRKPRSDAAEAARRQFSGDDVEEAIPDPIPNSEVKLFRADGTARARAWESRSSPGLSLKARSSRSGLSLFNPFTLRVFLAPAFGASMQYAPGPHWAAAASWVLWCCHVVSRVG
jgi:hypothetical protein